MNNALRFIVVDDDPVSNFLCRIVIKQALGEINIKTSEFPEEVLHFIEGEFATTVADNPVILLLDINMPVMSGWEFLEHFDKLDDKIKSQLNIYILSSSVDSSDRERAKQNKNVIDYIEKPIRKEVVLKIASRIQAKLVLSNSKKF